MNKHMMWDAQASLAFVVSQTAYIETAVNKTIYPDIQYPSLVPVDTSAPPFAKTVTYYSSDMFGRAKWINGNAMDIPMAGTELAKFETAVHTAGIGYGYGWEELGQAQMLGRNLQADDAMAARRAYEEFVDAQAILGKSTDGTSTKGFLGGLINHSSITPAAAPVGDWGGTGTDWETIMADINEILGATWTGTNYTGFADTLLLPFLKMTFLNTKVIPGTSKTLLQHIRETNIFTTATGQTLDIRGVRGLETAGVGPSQRMVAYRKSDQVLKMHIPMTHRFFPPQQVGLYIQVPGVFRLGGLDIRRPAEVKYRDGI